MTHKPLQKEHYIELDGTFSAPNYKPLDIVIARGEGVWLYDVDGRRYLDCLSAYSAVNQGHCNPRILQAVIEQAGRLTLTSRAFRNDQMGPFLQKLCELSGFEMALPMNTGAEAVETAIKLARKWAYQIKGVPEGEAEIITCAANFHGRTTTIVSFSTDPQARADFGPFTPGFTTIPFGDADALAAAITPNTAAFLVEPIQGEGGIIMPPAGYLAAVEAICRAHNVLLIVDEIQTGLGRTGALFAFEHEAVQPDVVTVGKALSGGFYPVSAVLSSRAILSVFQPGDHGSTYGGNPLGAAAGRAALEVLVDEKLVERSAQLGAYLKTGLARIESEHIIDVRGKGLFIGIELNKPARPFCEKLAEQGLLCKDTHTTIVRLAPPLVITKAEIDWALERIESVFLA